MKRFLLPLLSVAMGVSTASAAMLQTISVDFYGSATTLLEPTDVAGAPAYAASNWNLVSGGTLAAPVVLNDSDGIATSVELTDVTAKKPSPLAEHSWTATTANQKLFDGHIAADKWFGNPAISFTLDNLDLFSSYDLVVYFSTEYNGNRYADISVSQADTPTYYSNAWNYGNPQPGNFVQVTSTDSLNRGVGNYVVFSGLTDSTLTFNYKVVDQGQEVTGFQIIGTMVPEPGTSALALLGAIAFLSPRRRR